RLEQRVRTQYAVTVALAECDTVLKAMPAILRIIGETLSWEFGLFWAFDRSTQTLRCDQRWSPSDPQSLALARDAAQRTFERGRGVPGTVWASGRPLWIADVENSELFARTEAARADGFHAAFAFPVTYGNEVAGVFEV